METNAGPSTTESDNAGTGRATTKKIVLAISVLAVALMGVGYATAKRVTEDTDVGEADRAPTSRTADSRVETSSDEPDRASENSVSSAIDVGTVDGREVLGGATESGFGDPLFEGLGNGGYDTQHYQLHIDTAGGPDGEGDIIGEATISLIPITELASLSLDLLSLTVDEVSVDGVSAPFDHSSRELTIWPDSPLQAGETATVTVSYHGRPVPITFDEESFGIGWQTTDWGSYVASEPTGAATWFPSNDHPGDKATYEISVTVEAGLYAVGPGTLVERRTAGDNETFVYSMPHQMASYLASIVIGDFVVQELTGPNGVNIRNVLFASEADRLDDILERTSAPMLEFFSDLFGPYPFDTYGIVAVPEPLNYALENQTLSLFGTSTIAADSTFTSQLLAHELAHQWFGNSITVTQWDDIWLNEGFSQWADTYWLESTQDNKRNPFDLLEDTNQSRDYDPIKGLEADDLFDRNIYVRGALTLEALRRTVGEEVFFDFIQTWVSVNAHSGATTAEFVDMVENFFGQDVRQLIEAWIFDENSPALPDR